MDNVTKELKTNNMKLKGLVESVRPCCAKHWCQYCECFQNAQAFCALADALKAKFLYRHHLDLHPSGPGVVPLHDVQEQMSQMRVFIPTLLSVAQITDKFTDKTVRLLEMSYRYGCVLFSVEASSKHLKIMTTLLAYMSQVCHRQSYFHKNPCVGNCILLMSSIIEGCLLILPRLPLTEVLHPLLVCHNS